jgi:hypothetical protein
MPSHARSFCSSVKSLVQSLQRSSRAQTSHIIFLILIFNFNFNLSLILEVKLIVQYCTMLWRSKKDEQCVKKLKMWPVLEPSIPRTSKALGLSLSVPNIYLKKDTRVYDAQFSRLNNFNKALIHMLISLLVKLLLSPENMQAGCLSLS